MKIFYQRSAYLMFAIYNGKLIPYWSGGSPSTPQFEVGKAINYFSKVKSNGR